MIQKEVKSHPLAYLVLMVGIIVFCYSFFSVWPDPKLERYVIVGFSLFYFVWGIVAQKTRKQVTKKIIGEYAFVSLIGALLLLMLTF